MSTLLNNLANKYSAEAQQPPGAAMAAASFAPAGQPKSFMPAGTAPTIGNNPQKWYNDWNVCPPNVKPDVHQQAYDWVQKENMQATPYVFYAKQIAQGGVLGPDWLVDPNGPNNPVQLADQEMAAEQAQQQQQQTVAVNPPAAQGGVPPLNDGEIIMLRMLSRALEQFVNYVAGK